MKAKFQKFIDILLVFIAFNFLAGCYYINRPVYDDTEEGMKFEQMVELQNCFFYIKENQITDIEKIKAQGFFKNLPDNEREVMILKAIKLYNKGDGE